MIKKVAALYVVKDGPYSKVPEVDLWPEERDARTYAGPYPVVAHPPCQRWGRYWSGGPSATYRRKLGDDGGCFKSALSSVRKWGGVLEHPEASHAFKKFRLPIPAWHGGWTRPDFFGGSSCCVSQGHYGHPARKMTWLYAVGAKLPELIWGPSVTKVRLDLGFHSAEERRRAVKRGNVEGRLSHRQRLLTPKPFMNLLISISKTVRKQKEENSMKLEMEMKVLAGNDSKQFLVELTKQIDRLELLAGKLGKGAAKKAPGDDEDEEEARADAADDDDDDDEEFAAKKPVKKKPAFEDDEEDDADDEDDEDEEEDDEDDEPKAKTKGKKITADDCNDAAKARAASVGGKKGREEVLKLMKKHFGTESVSELKPDQYAKFIKVMEV